MSRLLDNLRELPLNERKAIPESRVTAGEFVQEHSDFRFITANKYKFVAEFSFTGLARDDSEGRRLRQKAREALVESVFGEFNPNLTAIEEALWNYDVEEAKRLLRELRAAMFSI